MLSPVVFNLTPVSLNPYFITAKTLKPNDVSLSLCWVLCNIAPLTLFSSRDVLLQNIKIKESVKGSLPHSVLLRATWCQHFKIINSNEEKYTLLTWFYCMKVPLCKTTRVLCFCCNILANIPLRALLFISLYCKHLQLALWEFLNGINRAPIHRKCFFFFAVLLKHEFVGWGSVARLWAAPSL